VRALRDAGERRARRGRGAPLMFGIGPEELILVLVVALLVLGPERLPRVARDVGRVVGDLRRTSDEFREEFLQADKYLEKPVSTTPTPVAEPTPAAIPATDADRPERERFRSRDARGPREARCVARKARLPRRRCTLRHLYL
jgi:Tat protein translocase TatB subunit